MPNPYFGFKQFTVFHDRCAMKVTTDACLFGAWLAQQLKATAGKSALDIGAGSGLLSLMVAQQSALLIDAVELEKCAALQAKANVARSPWPQKIVVHEMDIIDFNSGPFDVIFSNPPFYEKEIVANTSLKNIAHHSEGLRLENLLQKTESLLAADGDVYLLLPYKRIAEIAKLLYQKKWYLLQQVIVHPSPTHPPSRLFLHVSKKQKFDTSHQTIYINKAGDHYSNEFIQLLKDYYLYL